MSYRKDKTVLSVIGICYKLATPSVALELAIELGLSPTIGTTDEEVIVDICEALLSGPQM